MTTTVEFENDRIRVVRVKHSEREAHPQTAKGDRLIIYLNDGHIVRTVDEKKEEIAHKVGEVVWRDRSQHQITNVSDTAHEVIIVEFK
jgi:hypothetical protein